MNSYTLKTQKAVISFINSNEEYRKIYRPLKQKIVIGRSLRKIPFYVMVVVVAVGALVSERLISNYSPNTNFLIMIIAALISTLIIAIVCGFF